ITVLLMGIWEYLCLWVISSNSVLCGKDVFFFQAADGIRDFHVTGVQTCALPIWRGPDRRPDDAGGAHHRGADLGAADLRGPRTARGRVAHTGTGDPDRRPRRGDLGGAVLP